MILENEIVKNWIGNPSKPIVSICCITYNHEKYIGDAIEGFLIQKTESPFEIIIHDDASTDNTADIVKSYAKKYQNLIFPIFQKENQYSKGKKIFVNYVWPKARGKYIALCEGDDFWIDENKIQKQIDFLRSNSDCTMCFHPAKILDVNNNKFIKRPKYIPKNKRFSIKNVLPRGGGFITTASMVMKSSYLKNLPIWLYNVHVGDFPLVLITSARGKIGYIDEVMCVYRNGVPNSWSSNSIYICSKKHLSDAFYLLNEFNKWTNHKYSYFVLLRKIMQIIACAKVKVKTRYLDSYCILLLIKLCGKLKDFRNL